MIRLIPAPFLFIATLVSGSAFAAKFNVDPVHSNVDFTIGHLVGHFRGSFAKFEGSFDFDEAKGEGLENVTFKVDAASINTGNEDRNKHLRSPDFFNVAKNPSLVFLSKKGAKYGGKNFKLDGDLTLNGVTKPVTWDVDYLGTGPNMMGGQAVGFTATTKVNRKDYGISWNKTLDNGSIVLSDEVTLRLNIEAAKADAPKKK